jgi:hypothetical protein
MTDTNANADDGTKPEAGTTSDQQGNPTPPATDTQKPDPASTDAPSPFAAFDEDTRTWAEKRGFKTVDDAVKTAYEQSKLLGNAIRIPGKDATDAERDEFLNKLGRPATAEEYKFTPPEDLPEDLPYDGERAKTFAGLAHKLGLTADQAKGIHDWAAQNALTDYKAGSETRHEQVVTTAKAETEKLIKAWGPLDGETMKVNLSFADKALQEIGGADAVAEFRRVGLIGSEGDKIVTSAPIAQMLAKVGRSLYKEDEVLKGNAAHLNNPFEDGAHFNVTNQMKLIKSDPDKAREMIASAGKTPKEFGLKG